MEVVESLCCSFAPLSVGWVGALLGAFVLLVLARPLLARRFGWLATRAERDGAVP